MNEAIEEVKEQLEQSEADSFAKVAKYLPPNVLAGIAEEIVQGQCPFADQIVEICFDIERGNNGAAEFISYIISNR